MTGSLAPYISTASWCTARWRYPIVATTTAIGMAERMMAATPTASRTSWWFARSRSPQALNIHTGTTAFACALFLLLPVIYVAVYTTGILVARTLAFTGGWIPR